eukprot:s1944_g13.t1
MITATENVKLVLKWGWPPTQLLSKVTTLADPTSDVASRFSDSLELEGLNVTSIQMLEVPKVISTESHLQESLGRGYLVDLKLYRMGQLVNGRIVLWILMGVAISTVAGCAAWSAGYLCGYLYDSSFDAPTERSGLSPPVNKTISRKSHDAGGTLRATAHQNTGKSVIREVLQLLLQSRICWMKSSLELGHLMHVQSSALEDSSCHTERRIGDSESLDMDTV